MIRLNGIARPGSVLTVLVAACLLFTMTPADAASSKKKSKGLSPEPLLQDAIWTIPKWPA